MTHTHPPCTPSHQSASTTHHITPITRLHANVLHSSTNPTHHPHNPPTPCTLTFAHSTHFIHLFHSTRPHTHPLHTPSHPPTSHTLTLAIFFLQMTGTDPNVTVSERSMCDVSNKTLTIRAKNVSKHVYTVQCTHCVIL